MSSIQRSTKSSRVAAFVEPVKAVKPTKFNRLPGTTGKTANHQAKEKTAVSAAPEFPKEIRTVVARGDNKLVAANDALVAALLTYCEYYIDQMINVNPYIAEKADRTYISLGNFIKYYSGTTVDRTGRERAVWWNCIVKVAEEGQSWKEVTRYYTVDELIYGQFINDGNIHDYTERNNSFYKKNKFIRPFRQLQVMLLEKYGLALVNMTDCFENVDKRTGKIAHKPMPQDVRIYRSRAHVPDGVYWHGLNILPAAEFNEMEKVVATWGSAEVASAGAGDAECDDEECDAEECGAEECDAEDGSDYGSYDGSEGAEGAEDAESADE